MDAASAGPVGRWDRIRGSPGWRLLEGRCLWSRSPFLPPFFSHVSHLPPASRNQTSFPEGMSTWLFWWISCYTERFTLSYSISLYKAGGPHSEGGGRRTLETQNQGSLSPRSVAHRGSWSARQRAFPVRISFKYEVDFIFPRCN